MLMIEDKLHAAVSAGNAPEGYISTNVSEALEIWEEQSGHLLWVRTPTESVYFVARNDTPIDSSVEASITEVMPANTAYTQHPSVTSTITEDTFRLGIEGLRL